MAETAVVEKKEKKVQWKDDPLREILREDIRSGLIPAHWTPKLAQQLHPEYLEMHGLFSSRLRGMREAIAKGTDEKTKKQQRWDDNHPVRQKLMDDVRQSKIPDDMDARAAWKLREEYESIPFDLWKDCLKGMRAIVKKKREAAADDEAALRRDRLVYPKSTINLMDKPEWDGSEAQICLEHDLDDDLHKEMSPQELWQSRLQYQEFELDVFRGHIYQELHTRKWRNQWVNGKKEYALVSEKTAHP